MSRPAKPKPKNLKRRFSIYTSKLTIQKLDEYTTRNKFETRGDGLTDLLTKVGSLPEECTQNYLDQLEKEKTEMSGMGDRFSSSIRLIDNEITRVKAELKRLAAAEAEISQSTDEGTAATTSANPAAEPMDFLVAKIYMPVMEHPDVDFAGLILGSRFSTVKKLEKATGCSIAVRGKGSLRDQKKELRMRGKPTWEHLSDDLHILIKCKNDNDGKSKLKRAVDEVKKLLVPPPEGELEDGQWSRGDVDKLRRAIRACNPLTRDQWSAVANSIGNSRSWEDCKMYAESNLRFRPKLARIASPPVVKTRPKKRFTKQMADDVYGDMPQLLPTRVRTLLPVPQAKPSAPTSLGVSCSTRLDQSPSSTRVNISASNSDDAAMTIGPEARKRASLLIRRVEPVLAKSILKETMLEAKRRRIDKGTPKDDLTTKSFADDDTESNDAVYITVDDL